MYSFVTSIGICYRNETSIVRNIRNEIKFEIKRIKTVVVESKLYVAFLSFTILTFKLITDRYVSLSKSSERLHKTGTFVFCVIVWTWFV